MVWCACGLKFGGRDAVFWGGVGADDTCGAPPRWTNPGVGGLGNHGCRPFSLGPSTHGGKHGCIRAELGMQEAGIGPYQGRSGGAGGGVAV